jgi:hypothetical protein
MNFLPFAIKVNCDVIINRNISANLEIEYSSFIKLTRLVKSVKFKAGWTRKIKILNLCLDYQISIPRIILSLQIISNSQENISDLEYFDCIYYLFFTY